MRLEDYVDRIGFQKYLDVKSAVQKSQEVVEMPVRKVKQELDKYQWIKDLDGIILRDIQDITLDMNIRESSLVEQMCASTLQLANEEFRYSDFTGSDLSDKHSLSGKIDKTY